MAILQELQSLSVVTGIVSRIAAPGNVLQKFFNMDIGNPAVEKVSGRAYSYDIFDNIRDAANGRRPGTGPAVVAPVPSGRQTQVFPRQYEKMPMTYELLHNLRSLGQNAGIRDKMGKVYIEKQAMQMKRRANNFRELMIGALLRQGTIGFQYDGSGDDLIPVFTVSGPGDTYDFLIPSGNKSTLNMTGGGAIISALWSNVGTDIPSQIFAINAAFQNLTGQTLRHIFVPTAVWMMVLQNTAVRNLAGSANKPFADFAMLPNSNEDGQPVGLMSAQLGFCPWVQWHVYDGGLNVNGTYTQLLPINQATFTIDLDGGWIKGVEGSEPVKENPIAPAIEQFGFTSWIREWDEPARLELHSLQNFLIELNTPKGIAIGTVA